MATPDSLLNLKHFITMQREWLLPYGFKWVGWLMLAIAVPVGIWAAAIGFNYQNIAWLQALQLADTPLINNHLVLWMWLGTIFVGCSREKVEDEMISRIRLNALLTAFYIQAAFIIVATLVFNSLDYLNIMVYNLVTYPLIFIGTYEVMLWHARKEGGDEE